MKEGLAIKFNHKAPKKEIKTENDIRTGQRRDDDGSMISVRGGKVISGGHKPILSKIQQDMRQQAGEVTARLQEDVRVALLRSRTEGIKIHAKPGM